MTTRTRMNAGLDAEFPTIDNKLNNFIETQNIPHIIFYGASGTGKRRTVHKFITRIYENDKHQLKNNVMAVNCAHGKGIKFIRENLKNFARANIQTNNGVLFKTIVLYNADKLTIDAQSALRRCIEIFSRSTRFFIIVENKHKLFNPILSRFCEIYFPRQSNIADPDTHALSAVPFIEKEVQEILDIFPPHTFDTCECAVASPKKESPTPSQESAGDEGELQAVCSRGQKTTAEMENIRQYQYAVALRDLSQKFYNRGLSAMAVVEKLRNCTKFNIEKRISLVLLYQKIKSDVRNEKFLIFYLLDFLCLRSNEILKSITDM
jgi:hypothetical protein